MKDIKLLKTISDSMTKCLSKCDFLFNDPFLNYIYNKAEKINLAIYLITDHIGDGEILKTKIRHKSVEIVDVILSYNNLSFQKDDQKARSFIANSIAIMSYMKTATMSGLIRETNYFILSKELNNMVDDFIKRVLNNTVTSGELKDQILAVKDTDILVKAKQTSKGQNNIKDTQHKSIHFIKDKKTDQEDNSIVNNRHSVLKKVKPLESNTFSKQSLKKLRREKILAMFSDNRGYNVKDISVTLPYISEKTVQRELNNLVNENVLYKKGDRRWTKYFLRL